MVLRQEADYDLGNDRPKASKDHPTMKPVALMSYPIQNSCMSNLHRA